MGNGGKQTWRQVEGGEQEDLLPSLLNPAPSLFFLAHFSLLFPNYLKVCYRLTTCIHSFPTFYGVCSTWASSTFGALLLISRNGFGSTNFATAFGLQNCLFFFFLVFFLLFFSFVSFYRIFRRIFCFSPPSHSVLPPPPPLPPPSAPDKRERPFAPDPSFHYSALLAYAKSTGCFVVWKTLHWLTFKCHGNFSCNNELQITS